MKKVRCYVAVLLCIAIIMQGCKVKKASFITIGTGGVTGIYYPTGIAISRMVNKNFDQYKIKVTVESTSGWRLSVWCCSIGQAISGV
jgi:TRAP-type uncharacterized transport system substrate-binding protein